jgi:hypothetical protein
MIGVYDNKNYKIEISILRIKANIGLKVYLDFKN